MATFIYSTPIPITETPTTLKFRAVDSAGNAEATQTAVYELNTSIGYLVQPSSNGTIISYGTKELGVFQSQATQSQAVSGSLSFTGTASQNQTAQTRAATGTISISGIASQTQPNQSQAASNTAATLRYSEQPYSLSGVIYYSTEEILAGFVGAIVQLSPQQQQIANALQLFTGSAVQTQPVQTRTGTGVNTSHFVTQNQTKQQQAAVSSLQFIGVVGQAQQNQSSTSTGLTLGDSEAVVSQTQQANQQAVSAGLYFAGSVTQEQTVQRQSANDSLRFINVGFSGRYIPLGEARELTISSGREIPITHGIF